MKISTPTTKSLWLLGFALLSQLFCPVQGSVRCFSIFDCKERVHENSECISGFCSNPYHKGGCLPSRLKDHYKVRTCNSDDPPSAAENGYCRPSALEYVEVRIGSQNWESVFFVCWILQILLSELLDVPVTIETASPDAHLDFYDLQTRFQYGSANVWSAMRQTKVTPDCRDVKGQDPYVPCNHVVPEVWSNHEANLQIMQDEEVIEPRSGLGALGQQMWFMRRKTAVEHPQFMTYLGMQGETNRPKLADVFKRPTTWGDYCSLVSTDNCAEPDDYAQRAPSLDGEADKYYVGGEFRGFFRATEKNNCTATPDTCTGHIVDYPCGWSSYIEAQTHHLDIALESNGNQPGSNGFSYSEMVQIWTAANETDEHVLMQWWRPEALYQEFLGTDSEFQGVTLPPPTQDCIDNRVNPEQRCSDDPVARLGNPLGACAEAPHALYKVVSKALFEISFEEAAVDALDSPAYDAINNFRITDLQMGKIFDYWFAQKRDKWNLDPRDATCDWVIENLDQLKSYIPRTHPRVMEDNDDAYKQPVFFVAIALACVAIAFTFVSTSITYCQREKAAMRYSQIEFLFLILIGLLLVSLGSLLTALSPTDPLCVTIEWFINIGYTLELVPLIVKIAAINRLMTATAQMRRVKLRMSSLFGAVFAVCAAVGVLLVIWTAVDPPQKEAEVELTSEKTDNGETVVERTFYCASDEDAWHIVSVSWQLLLLLCASVLAFQTRKMREDLNETKTLAMMIYSHFVFVMLQALTYLLDGSLSQADLAAARSIILSADTVATLIIYFLPKFMASENSTAPWLKNQSMNPNPEQPTGPLNVHTWQSRNQSTASAVRRPPQFDADSADLSGSNYDAPLSSMRQSSTDYRTQAEWEDPNGGGDKNLDAVSEEDFDGSEMESMQDEDEGMAAGAETKEVHPGDEA